MDNLIFDETQKKEIDIKSINREQFQKICHFIPQESIDNAFFESIYTNNVNAFDIIFEKANIKSHDDDYFTPLMVASGLLNQYFVKVLCDNGSDVNYVDDDGNNIVEILLYLL